MSRTLYGHHIETIKGEDYVLHKDYTELQNKYYKQKEIIDNIKEILKDYGDKEDISGITMYYISGENLIHILELFEEIDEEKKDD